MQEHFKCLLWRLQSLLWDKHKFKCGINGLREADGGGQWRPSTSTTDLNIEAMKKMILSSRQIAIREVANDVGNVAWTSLRRCWRHSTPIQICSKEVITGNESWTFDQSPIITIEASRRANTEKKHKIRSNAKALLTIFFDCNAVLHHELFQQDLTVNKEYYLQVMHWLREVIRLNRTELWKNQSFCTMITHQFTHRCLCDSFWSKTRPQHCIYGTSPTLTFSSSQNWGHRWKESVLLWLRCKKKWKQELLSILKSAF